MSKDNDKRFPLRAIEFPAYPVIDLAEKRIERGLPAHPTKICDHGEMVYDSKSRTVWCKRCESNVDGFDAFEVLAKQFHGMLREVQARDRKAREALASTVRRRAAKKLEKAWHGGKYAVCCPHCRRGLLPEDFEDGSGILSRELEVARRSREAEG